MSLQQLVIEPCRLCRDRQYVEIPLAEPGDPELPPHPDRVRLFIYGCARALAEIEGGTTRLTKSGDQRRR